MSRLTILLLLLCCSVGHAGLALKNAGFESRDYSGWAIRGAGWSIDHKKVSKGESAAVCRVKKGDAAETRACVQALSGIEVGRIVEVQVDVSAISVVQSANSKVCLAVLCMDTKNNLIKEYRSGVTSPGTAFMPVKIDDAVILPGTEQVYVMLVVEVFRNAEDDDWWRFDEVLLNIR
ncbi:MAG: hypothetical protein JXR25_17130 [Pontiellaceae bacterium]|nr:hypothetical protein [Pontiellaceae bacterium]